MQQPLREVKPTQDSKTPKTALLKTKTALTDDYIKAKHKAFEKYKAVYPVEDKENLYPARKMPSMGYFIMKGYKPELALSQSSTDDWQFIAASAEPHGQEVPHPQAQRYQADGQAAPAQNRALPLDDARGSDHPALQEDQAPDEDID